MTPHQVGCIVYGVLYLYLIFQFGDRWAMAFALAAAGITYLNMLVGAMMEEGGVEVPRFLYTVTALVAIALGAVAGITAVF